MRAKKCLKKALHVASDVCQALWAKKYLFIFIDKQ
jgi:hypothetical protein